LVLLLLVMVNSVAAQPYQIGHITATFIDSARSNRSVPVEIYYPADVAGDNTAFAASITGKVPTIAFGHGFVMAWSAYQNIWEAVVPVGYIIIFPKTEGTFSPSHDAFGKDLSFVLEELAELGNTTTSILYNKVDTMTCVMGHSMGGGAAHLAAAANTRIKAIATLAPAETTPSAIAAAAAINANTLVIAGQNDCVTPPATNQLPMYDATPATCKHYISITGGSHCLMAETNTACSFGESSCTPTPTIDRTTQHTIINRYLIPWLNSRLKNDCTSGSLFDATLAAATDVTHQKNCTLCSTANLSNTTETSKIWAHPNPFVNNINITAPSYGDCTVRVYNVLGVLVHIQSVNGSATLSLAHLATGIYQCSLQTESGRTLRTTLVKE
jgi:pimeloyl-ACP methyl ester carboxylesterase